MLVHCTLWDNTVELSTWPPVSVLLVRFSYCSSREYTSLPECDDPNIESLWVHIRPSRLSRSVSSMILCVVYHSTVNSEPENIALCQHIQSNLDTILAKQPNALVIVTGDFNPTTTGLKEKDLTLRNHLKQMVNFKTRDTGILDWFLTNRPNLFKLSQLPKMGASDHYTILANPLICNPLKVAANKVQVRDMRDSAWRSFGRWMTEKDRVHVFGAPTCKDKYTIFMNELTAAIDLLLPWKTVRSHPTDRPWNSKKLKTLILKRQKAFLTLWKDSNSYKQLRNIIQQEIRSAKRNYYQHKVLDLENTNCMKWWSQIRSIAGQYIRQNWSCQFLDDSCPDIRTLANKVNDFFYKPVRSFYSITLPTPHASGRPYKALSTVKRECP